MLKSFTMATGGRTRRIVPALGVACAALAFGSSAPGAAPASTPVKFTKFTGRVVSGTGHYAHLRTPLRMILFAGRQDPGLPLPYRSASTVLAFGLRMGDASCRWDALFSANCSTCPAVRAGRPRVCSVVAGNLSGIAVAIPGHPDAGTTFRLSGEGHIGLLGKVAATGTVRGVGFIDRGRYSLLMRVEGGSGSIVISAHGPLVHGFSTPFLG